MDFGFTGTQRGMTLLQRGVFQAWITKLSGFHNTFHHGDCIGADEEAHRIVESIGFKPNEIFIYPCNIEDKRAHCQSSFIHYPMPPLVRNKTIVNYSKIIFATPGEVTEQGRSGTWSTIRYARKFKSKKIIIIYPDGTIEE